MIVEIPRTFLNPCLVPPADELVIPPIGILAFLGAITSSLTLAAVLELGLWFVRRVLATMYAALALLDAEIVESHSFRRQLVTHQKASATAIIFPFQFCSRLARRPDGRDIRFLGRDANDGEGLEIMLQDVRIPIRIDDGRVGDPLLLKQRTRIPTESVRITPEPDFAAFVEGEPQDVIDDQLAICDQNAGIHVGSDRRVAIQDLAAANHRLGMRVFDFYGATQSGYGALREDELHSGDRGYRRRLKDGTETTVRTDKLASMKRGLYRSCD